MRQDTGPETDVEYSWIPDRRMYAAGHRTGHCSEMRLDTGPIIIIVLKCGWIPDRTLVCNATGYRTTHCSVLREDTEPGIALKSGWIPGRSLFCNAPG